MKKLSRKERRLLGNQPEDARCETATEIAEEAVRPEPPKTKINYPTIMSWVYSRPKLVLAIKWFEIAAVAFIIATYVLFGALMAIIDSPLRAIVYIIVTEVAFFAVSMMRVWLDFKRPYERYDTDALGIVIEKKRCGRGFPSRHVFSAFIIGVLLLPSLMPLGIAVLALGALMAFTRVVSGKHFLTDVLAGAGIGIVLGMVGVISMALIG